MRSSEMDVSLWTANHPQLQVIQFQEILLPEREEVQEQEGPDSGGSTQWRLRNGWSVSGQSASTTKMVCAGIPNRTTSISETSWPTRSAVTTGARQEAISVATEATDSRPPKGERPCPLRHNCKNYPNSCWTCRHAWYSKYHFTRKGG